MTEDGYIEEEEFELDYKKYMETKDILNRVENEDIPAQGID